MSNKAEKKAAFQASVIWRDRKRTIFGLPLSFTKYILTKERLFIETGFLNKKEDEVRLYRIMDVSLSRTLGQRIFGVGTIKCCSADKTLADFEIKNIKNSRDVKEQLSQAVEDERVSKKVINREILGHEGHDGHDGPDHDMPPEFHDPYEDDVHSDEMHS